MAKVVMTGWGNQIHTINLIKAIKEHTELGLRGSKDLAERFIDEKTVTISVPDLETAQSLAAQIRKADVICHVEE